MPEDANFIQRFIDSDFGIVFAAAAHTFGALLFTAGIALYLYQARLVQHAKDAGQMPTLKWLPLAHVLNIIGIGLNGMGGLMRLKESDHPGLEDLGASLWVQVILIKHLFLVVGVGLALYLTADTFLLARKPEAPTNFVPKTKQMTSFAVASFITILAASVFGGIASNALPTMGTALEGTNNAMEGGGAMDGMEHTNPVVYYQNGSTPFTTVAQSQSSTVDVDLPAGTSEVLVTLTWGSAQSNIDAVLLRASDQANVGAEKTGPQGTTMTLKAAGPEGAATWTLRITAQTAVQETVSYVIKKTVGEAA